MTAPYASTKAVAFALRPVAAAQRPVPATKRAGVPLVPTFAVPAAAHAEYEIHTEMAIVELMVSAVTHTGPSENVVIFWQITTYGVGA